MMKQQQQKVVAAYAPVCCVHYASADSSLLVNAPLRSARLSTLLTEWNIEAKGIQSHSLVSRQPVDSNHQSENINPSSSTLIARANKESATGPHSSSREEEDATTTAAPCHRLLIHLPKRYFYFLLFTVKRNRLLLMRSISSDFLSKRFFFFFFLTRTRVLLCDVVRPSVRAWRGLV